MSASIISVKDVTIAYKSVNSISYKALLKNLLKKDGKENNGKIFKAVRNVSFNLEKGDTLGIIGENGSGKSTLLRALAGIYQADEGEIQLNCSKISLLALGVGFQTRLTGFQNIYLSGYAMGFTKQEVEDKIDAIIEFAELGEFIYKPVKTYSSGMYSKLAFSISSILATDVLLIDEVLSVGDIRFRKKSREKILEMISDKNRSVVIVTHDTSTLREICDKVLWMHRGETKMYGNTEEVFDAYEKFMLGEKKCKKK